MRQDASVECGTGEHESITDLATGFIVLWPAGSLVLFTSLLAACYKPLQAKTPNALTRATAFLHREYEKTWYWWEAVELARKLVLTGFVLLIPEERAFVRLVVATLICSCYAVALAVVRPYKRVEDNVLAVATRASCSSCSSSAPTGAPPSSASRSGTREQIPPMSSASAASM